MIRIATRLILLLAGGGAVVVGALFHNLPVIEEKERLITVTTATPFDAPTDLPRSPGERENPFAAPPGGKALKPLGASERAAGGPTGNPFESPSGTGGAKPEAASRPFSLFDERPLPDATSDETPASPDALTRKVVEKYLETRHEPEWLLAREMTVGGVTRLANGELKQTYSGKPPALCPT